jgi:hypothetical protein
MGPSLELISRICHYSTVFFSHNKSANREEKFVDARVCGFGEGESGGGGEFYDLGGGHGRGCRTGDNNGDEIGGRALLDDEIREVSQVVGVAVVLTRQEVDLVITATEGGVA